MSREDRKYSRVYWSVNDDPKFDGIRGDSARFGTWVRLLMVADAVWPSSPTLPRWVRKGHLDALIAAGIVDVLPEDRFRIRGMDAERSARSNAASNAAASRWRMPRQDETSKDETRRDEVTHEVDDKRADLEAFVVLTRRAPTPKQRRLLDEMLDRHDLTGPAWAADIMYRHPDDPIGAVIDADKTWRDAKIAEARAHEKPTPKPRRPKGLPQTTREIMAEMAMLNRETA